MICAGGGAASKVGVSGDSAGAMIAAAVAHDVKGIDFQVLQCLLLTFRLG
jgi:acetyl esterase/lipase